MALEKEDEYKILVKGVKGLKKLEIKHDWYDVFIKSRIKFIYGPNGSGKSSLKLSISEADNVLKNEFRTWGTKKENLYVDERIKAGTQRYIFDDLFVNAILGNGRNSIPFGDGEISKLQDCMSKNINDENVLLENLPDTFVSSFLNIKNDDLKIFCKYLTNIEFRIKEINTYIKSWEINDITKTDKEMLKKINSLTSPNITNLRNLENYRNTVIKGANVFMEFEKTIKDASNILFGDGHLSFWPRNSASNQSRNNPHFFIDIKFPNYSIREEMLAINNLDDLSKFNFERFLELIELIIKALNSLIWLKDNFGLIKNPKLLDKNLNNIKIEIMYGGSQDELINSKIWDLLFWINNSTDFIEKFKKAWNSKLKDIGQILLMSNNVLEYYFIPYKISLVPITTDNDCIFGLEYKFNSSSKVMNIKDIQKNISYGELNIVAFSIFIATSWNDALFSDKKDDSNIKPLFVFDDPISSYDFNRVTISAAIIKLILFKKFANGDFYIISHEKFFIKVFDVIGKQGKVGETYKLINGKLEYCENGSKLSDMAFLKNAVTNSSTIESKLKAFRIILENILNILQKDILTKSKLKISSLYDCKSIIDIRTLNDKNNNELETIKKNIENIINEYDGNDDLKIKSLRSCTSIISDIIHDKSKKLLKEMAPNQKERIEKALQLLDIDDKDFFNNSNKDESVYDMLQLREKLGSEYSDYDALDAINDNIFLKVEPEIKKALYRPLLSFLSHDNNDFSLNRIEEVAELAFSNQEELIKIFINKDK